MGSIIVVVSLLFLPYKMILSPNFNQLENKNVAQISNRRILCTCGRQSVMVKYCRDFGLKNIENILVRKIAA